MLSGCGKTFLNKFLFTIIAHILFNGLFIGSTNATILGASMYGHDKNSIDRARIKRGHVIEGYNFFRNYEAIDILECSFYQVIDDIACPVYEGFHANLHYCSSLDPKCSQKPTNFVWFNYTINIDNSYPLVSKNMCKNFSNFCGFILW
jgi:hypothetical protein